MSLLYETDLSIKTFDYRNVDTIKTSGTGQFIFLVIPTT